MFQLVPHATGKRLSGIRLSTLLRCSLRPLHLSFLLFVSLASIQAAEPHPIITAATSFYQQLIQGEMEAAYNSASSQFKRTNRPEDFLRFVHETEADQLTSFEITKATTSPDGGNGQIGSKGKNQQGKSRLVKMGLLLEDGVYRMSDFNVHSFGTSLPPSINDHEVSLGLVKKTLERAADCVKEGDIQPYVSEIAMLHRQTYGDRTLANLVGQLNATRYGPIAGMIEKLKPGRAAERDGSLARYYWVVDYPELKRRLLLDFISLPADP
ncbi:MAG: hypothetical protein KJT03_14965, partial [Verrucomicrobiae bacterium]|nr:hypothetical protein [Verrucomicrobiae bacterium]